MSDRGPRTFSMAIMQGGDAQRAPRDAVIAELAARNITLAGDELLAGDHLIGFGRFEDVSRAEGPLAAWIAHGERPWLGQSVGLFEWTHPMAGHDEIEALTQGLVHGAGGPVLRIDTAELRDMAIERSFRLDELTSEHGFDSGEALLTRHPGAYIDYVLDTIRSALTRAQIEPAWFGFSDRASRHENPIRLYPPVTHAGNGLPASEVDAVLYRVETVLWSFRGDIYDLDDNFWID
jgi:hypothetical protein